MIGVPHISRDEVECVGVGGADDGEMPAVERCDLGDPEALSRCDDRTIDGPEGQIPIPAHQLGDAKPITRHDLLDGELTSCEIAQEADLGVRAEPRPDEVGHFGDDEYGNDEGTWMLQQ